MKLSRTPAFRINLISLAVLAVLATAAPATFAQTTAAPAAADPSQKAYQLPPAPLPATLKAIAAASGATIRFDDAALAGRRSREVSGTLSVQEALVQALRGTGLVATVDGSVFSVVAQADAVILHPVVITARRDQAETEFKADRSDTATRSGTSLMDVPESVTILTSKLLESQQTVSVQDALANVSGVVLLSNSQGTPVYSIRGFSDNGNALVNGTESAFGTSAAVVTVERIEVLKGPQAILAGNGFPGGAVNVVLKRPQATPIRDITLQYGTHDDRVAAGDLSGAFTDDTRLTYRLTGSAAQARKGEGGYDGRTENAFMPQLRWKDAKLDITGGLSYLDNHVPFPSYTVFLAGAAGKPSGILSRPDVRLANADDGFDLRERKAFYTGEYKVGSGITVVSRLQRSLADQTLSSYIAQQRGPFNTANPFLTFIGVVNLVNTKTTSGDHYLRVEADTGPISHTLAVGVNHSDLAVSTIYGQDPQGRGVNVDLTSPVQAVFPATSSLPQNIVFDNNVRQRGVYVQDTLRWGDFSALVGWRRTNYHQVGMTTFNGRAGAPSPHDYGKGEPSLGLIYSVTPSASVYANLMKGATATFASRLCGAPLTDVSPPRDYRNKEVGAKFDLLDNRLSVTTAAFQLDETNALNYNPTGACYTLIPAQQTRGVELDILGRILPGWNVVANYSSSTVKDQTTPTTLYYGHPKTKASLWTTYDVGSGPLQGAGVGLGVVANSGSVAQDFVSGPVDIPHAVSLNTTLSYRRDDWAVIFGVKNLTDRLNYGPTVSSQYIPIQPGRTYALTLRKSFQ